jgi:DNA helicase IV
MASAPRTLRGASQGLIFHPRPLAARRRGPSLVDVTLDAAQRAAVERPPGDSLLVLGEAGHGKTTVALHRLAHLWRTGVATGDRTRAAVVVPSDGLAHLLQPLLRKVGVDVEVLTYDRWAAGQARRVFRRLPGESDTTPPAVMRLKRHPALRGAIEEVARRRPGIVDDDVDAAAQQRSQHVTRGDLQQLFGDRVLLEEVARRGGLAARVVEETLERTRVQFSRTAEQEWAHVTDRARLVAVDRRALDEGTPSGAANTVDVEDYAILFELGAQRPTLGRPAAPKRVYDILVVDEAQEFAPLELALLGRTLRPEGSLVVAGDAHQQTDDTASFPGWSEAMRELGRPTFDRVMLDIGYRCPPDVVELARAILRPSVPAHRPGSERILLRVFEEAGLLADWLAHGLEALLRRDRRASIALLCRFPRAARQLAQDLHLREVPARLVFDERFLPRGISVTTVDQVKGLEFDFVVVPDAGAGTYPDDEASRRWLYVAVTRARHEVALACVGKGSPLVGSTRDPRGRA